MLAQGHLVADPFFVDTPERVEDTASRFARTGQPAPPGWRRAERGGWVALRRGDARLPDQGWKIHASATAEEAPRVVDAVWEYCVEHGISFKFLRSRTLLALVNSKRAPRSAGGKLITIYPRCEESLERTLKELSSLLRGVKGPYILSDLRWGEGPLYLRYGGFSPRYCFGGDGEYVPAVVRPDGRPVPDVRGAVFKVPPWAGVPPFIGTRIRAARADTGGALPYRVEKALHFSNSGGVYRAADPVTGRRVVLREARPYAGVDDNGMDAVARLAREHTVLERLAGLDCVPRVIARSRHWEHHFLVEEFVEGERLHEAIGRRHPLFHPGAGQEEAAAYAQWACGVLDRVAAATAALHARGIVFGDLQPGNVLVRPDDSVCLVDFETSFDIHENFTPVMGTAGFIAPWARSGFAVDAYALDCLRLAVFCPLTELLRFDAHKHEQLVRLVEDRFPVPPGFGERLRAGLAPPPGDSPVRSVAWPVGPDARDDLPDGPDGGSPDGWEAVLGSLRDAIAGSATPERDDRLFPGDVKQFDGQGAALAFGAAGVLYALHGTGYGGCPRFEGYVDWLARAVERARWPRPGLYDGLAGTAYVLGELGRPQQARETAARLAGFDLAGCGVGLFGGIAGIALTLLHFGDVEAAVRLGDRLARVLDGDGPAEPAAVGLMRGWSGPALLFTRLFAETSDAGHLQCAEAALARDIARCGVSRGRYVHVRDRERRLTVLGRGSAGIGIALDAYLRQREDAHFSRLRDRIRDSLDTGLLLSSGLLDGHAGLLYALVHLGGPASARRVQLRGLGLHAVRFEGELAFPMDGLLRLSMDLATGTAGVLLAVHAATRPGAAAWLPFLRPA
ncbi:class III lanthionine synthetase LanKC [Streptomyces sp. NPDC026206]|uniref:class III lanthionine synthetase LanKC n=1 Tax=Streptomyces sp. NPDC026206 TaxID=3157089 RepID=UPI0033FE7A3A